MNILISNDDGYESEGIKVLIKRLSEEHNVYVVAPSSNRSAVSHHVTMFSDTVVTKITDKEYTCEGYPADCVSIGILSDLFDVKFDVVISGINHGGNLGTDIVYSGTCGAARQAVFNKVPGIALSIEPLDWSKVHEEGFFFEGLADFAAKNLETLMSLCSTTAPRKFVNVNAPSCKNYNGVKFANRMCVRDYRDTLKIVEEKGNLVSKFIMGNSKTEENASDIDYDIVHDKNITVSVVYAEPVCDKISSDVKLVL